MNPIRPLDLVRLRHAPSWRGTVLLVLPGKAFVRAHGCKRWERPRRLSRMWLQLELLELVPAELVEA